MCLVIGGTSDRGDRQRAVRAGDTGDTVRDLDIRGMDVVEVSPPLDPTNQTTLLAAYGIFGFIEERFLLGPVIASP